MEQPPDRTQRWRGTLSSGPPSSSEQYIRHPQSFAQLKSSRWDYFPITPLEKKVTVLQQELPEVCSSPDLCITDTSIILSQLPTLKKSSSQNCRCYQTSSNHHLTGWELRSHPFYF